jgi:hypothetical protein
MKGEATLSDGSTPHARHWLARALSWKLWLPVAALLLAATGALMYRESRLSAIPDIGEPFDVEEFRRLSVEPADNAWLDYEAAGALLVPQPAGLREEVEAALVGDWADATPAVRKWLADNQPALQRWREGTAKDRSLRVPPAEIKVESFAGAVSDQRTLMELSQLEALRCEATGDLSEEWQWVRALFRFSRHIGMYDSAVQRLIGIVAHNHAVTAACRWASLDEVPEEQLQSALEDVRVDYQMTPPPSVVIEFEFMIAVDDLNRVEELRETRAQIAAITLPSRPLLFLAHEPAATQRLLQHQTANLLQHADKPACEQPRYIRDRLYFDSLPPPGSQILPSTEFESQCLRTPLAATQLLRSIRISSCFRERARQSAFEVMLAAQAYRREFGQLPETLAELVAAGMLPRIPDDPWETPGAELQYERDAVDPSRATVWSVGENRVDDGGRIDPRGIAIGDEGLWIGDPPDAE